MKNRDGMKRGVLLLIVVLLLCAMLPMGHAETLDEWNRSCRNKTARTTPVYAIGDSQCLKEPVTTIPANTYVKVHSGPEGIVGIYYRTSDGRSGNGWTHRSNLKFAVVGFINEDGFADDMHELDFKDKYGYIPADGNAGNLNTSANGSASNPSASKLSSSSGSTTINVRNAASGDSAKIAEWKTGTEVEVFGLENGWYEIEYKGMHGFVMEKFLTLQEE